MNLKRWTITLLGCVVVLAVLASYKYLQIRKAIAFAESFPESAAAVETLRVDWSTVQQSAETTGEIVAPQMLVLRNEVAGRIASINFESGQRVGQGMILVQLDVAEEQARLAAARARAELARIELRRAEKLRTQRSISEENVDSARSQYQVAKADVAALQAQIDKKTLRAPFAAMTGIHTLEPGQILQANMAITSLVGIQDFLWVDFSLPFDRAVINVGDEIRIGLQARPELAIKGEVIAREPVISATSRNVRMRGRIPAHPLLSHNASVHVSIPGPGVRAMRVPANAVRRDSLGEFVYVLRAGQQAGELRAHRRPVELAAQDAETAIISKGLEAGELIATVGAFKLREGMLAKPAQVNAESETAEPVAPAQEAS